jgi:hypothetical protein
MLKFTYHQVLKSVLKGKRYKMVARHTYLRYDAANNIIRLQHRDMTLIEWVLAASSEYIVLYHGGHTDYEKRLFARFLFDRTNMDWGTGGDRVFRDGDDWYIEYMGTLYHFTDGMQLHSQSEPHVIGAPEVTGVKHEQT